MTSSAVLNETETERRCDGQNNITCPQRNAIGGKCIYFISGECTRFDMIKLR